MNQTDTKPLSPFVNILLWSIRIFVGLLFIFSGFVKANDITGFAYKLNEYWDIFGMTFLEPLSVSMAWFISVFEIGIAFALLAGYRMKFTAWILWLMIVFFTFLTGYAFISGKIHECGCFGNAIPLTAGQSFIKDLILLVLISIIFLYRNRIQPFSNGMAPSILTYGSFAAFGYFSYYCYQHLPVIDFLPYKIGSTLETVVYPSKANNFEPEGLGYPEVGMSFGCTQVQKEEFTGNALFIVINKIDQAPEEAIKKGIALAASLEGSGIKIYGLTTTGSSMLPEYKAKYNFNFCLNNGPDDTVLKSIVRSNPGYVLLKNGVIKDKWHHNDTPDKAEVMQLLQ